MKVHTIANSPWAKLRTVVEQNANLALEIAHYGYVLETGRIALADTSENLRKSEAVQRSYLGQ